MPENRDTKFSLDFDESINLEHHINNSLLNQIVLLRQNSQNKSCLSESLEFKITSNNLEPICGLIQNKFKEMKNDYDNLKQIFYDSFSNLLDKDSAEYATLMKNRRLKMNKSQDNCDIQRKKEKLQMAKSKNAFKSAPESDKNIVLQTSMVDSHFYDQEYDLSSTFSKSSSSKNFIEK